MNIYDNQYLLLKEQKLKEIISKDKTVTAVSIELCVTRKTIHIWLIRYKRFGISGLIHRKRVTRQSPSNKTSEYIEDTVIKLAKNYFHDGVETLADRLQYEYRITLHPVTIFRILKRRQIRYGERYTITQRNWKKKLYAHLVPGQEIQVDTTYPYGYGQSKVIYTAIDDATRFVYVCVYEKANAINTVDFLKQLQIHMPFDIYKVRSDQGKEFKNIKVSDYLKEHNIACRHNTPYSPEENGKIERFHKTLKHKALPYGFYPSDSLEIYQYKLTLFLHYYNYQKKHRGLGMGGKTPFQRFCELRRV
jgi:transposase InsO family protein